MENQQHRPLTPAENAILTIKVLLGAGGIIGLILAVDRFVG